jgi:hypothetical protein
VRPTDDVDCVVDVATTAEYYAFVARLRALGFSECVDEGAPLCRLVHAGIRVDVVATVDTGVGPTNRWYRAAVAGATRFTVDRVDVLAITPLLFVATKLEAFRGRGALDYQASHDLEDVLTVIAAMPSLRDQIDSGGDATALEIRRELAALASIEAFMDSVPGHFDGDDAGQARAALATSWLKSLPKD